MLELKNKFPNFTNPELFVGLCNQFENDGKLAQGDNLHLKRFHHGIIHKLTSAVYSLNGIIKIIQSRSLIHPLTSTGGTAPTPTPFDDRFKLGYFQDNFFNSLIGSLDVLSMQLNLIFNTPITDLRRCYFQSLTNNIVGTNPTGAIEGFLNDILTSNWFQETIPFRNCLTHRNQLDYIIKIKVIANVPTVTHCLPDDPLAPTYTFNNEIECVPFCEDKLNHFIDTINDVDALLITETQRIDHIPY